jgi:hypothetical protein
VAERYPQSLQEDAIFKFIFWLAPGRINREEPHDGKNVKGDLWLKLWFACASTGDRQEVVIEFMSDSRERRGSRAALRFEGRDGVV